jgi:hypothetical protein
MKLRIMRMSGLPVQLQDLENYKAEFGAGYDAAQLECGKDMLALQTKLQELENSLLAKYSNTGVQELPKSAKGWKQLLLAYQAPVLLAQSADNPNEMVLMVVDTPIGA